MPWFCYDTCCVSCMRAYLVIWLRDPARTKSLKSPENLPLKSKNSLFIAFSYYNFKRSRGQLTPLTLCSRGSWLKLFFIVFTLKLSDSRTFIRYLIVVYYQKVDQRLAFIFPYSVFTCRNKKEHSYHLLVRVSQFF